MRLAEMTPEEACAEMQQRDAHWHRSEDNPAHHYWGCPIHGKQVPAAPRMYPC